MRHCLLLVVVVRLWCSETPSRDSVSEPVTQRRLSRTVSDAVQLGAAAGRDDDGLADLGQLPQPQQGVPGCVRLEDDALTHFDRGGAVVTPRRGDRDPVWKIAKFWVNGSSTQAAMCFGYSGRAMPISISGACRSAPRAITFLAAACGATGPSARADTVAVARRGQPGRRSRRVRAAIPGRGETVPVRQPQAIHRRERRGTGHARGVRRDPARRKPRCRHAAGSMNPTSENAHRYAGIIALKLHRLDEAEEPVGYLLDTIYISPAAGFCVAAGHRRRGRSQRT